MIWMLILPALTVFARDMIRLRKARNVRDILIITAFYVISGIAVVIRWLNIAIPSPLSGIHTVFGPVQQLFANWLA